MVPDLQIEQIPLKKISWPAQERKHFGQAELEEMAATIRVHGILEPIGVIKAGDGFEGQFGQRRWLAGELAGLEFIPAIVRAKPITEAAAMEVRLIENLARESLRPLELSVGIDQLMKVSGLTVAEAGKRIGMKPAAAIKSLSLLQLPETIRRQIDAGAIGPAAGYELARVEDPQVRAELAAEVAQGKLTRDALARTIKSLKRPAAGSKEGGRSKVTARLTGHRMVTVQGEKLTVDSLIATLEELLNRCRKARSQKLALRTMLNVLADEARQSV